MCYSWLDHDLRAPEVIETGEDGLYGPYQMLLRVCKKCYREFIETRWLRPTRSPRPMASLIGEED